MAFVRVYRSDLTGKNVEEADRVRYRGSFKDATGKTLEIVLDIARDEIPLLVPTTEDGKPVAELREAKPRGPKKGSKKAVAAPEGAGVPTV